MLADCHVENIRVRIADNRDLLGEISALAVADTIRALLKEQLQINLVFAAAPSQNEFLAAFLRQLVGARQPGDPGAHHGNFQLLRHSSLLYAIGWGALRRGPSLGNTRLMLEWIQEAGISRRSIGFCIIFVLDKI